ncbi:hypothetical protein DFH08DRAFT_819173 [Mycena albidolilacea]|uniref:Uncharacterized protein n=1 Tax=Mycena albidolilacea TaxID=1033008 RepID=A0AAD6ZED3_9AGAR|nr:hypothetical protein DFH08DRAFT_819173 [Mycena albidolilacea]
MPPGYGDPESAAPPTQQSSNSPPRLRPLRVSLTMSELELQTFDMSSIHYEQAIVSRLFWPLAIDLAKDASGKQRSAECKRNAEYDHYCLQYPRSSVALKHRASHPDHCDSGFQIPTHPRINAPAVYRSNWGWLRLDRLGATTLAFRRLTSEPDFEISTLAAISDHCAAASPVFILLGIQDSGLVPRQEVLLELGSSPREFCTRPDSFIGHDAVDGVRRDPSVPFSFASLLIFRRLRGSNKSSQSTDVHPASPRLICASLLPIFWEDGGSTPPENIRVGSKFFCFLFCLLRCKSQHFVPAARRLKSLRAYREDITCQPGKPTFQILARQKLELIGHVSFIPSSFQPSQFSRSDTTLASTYCEASSTYIIFGESMMKLLRLRCPFQRERPPIPSGSRRIGVELAMILVEEKGNDSAAASFSRPVLCVVCLDYFCSSQNISSFSTNYNASTEASWSREELAPIYEAGVVKA